MFIILINPKYRMFNQKPEQLRIVAVFAIQSAETSR